jgi:hypothetical protein
MKRLVSDEALLLVAVLAVVAFFAFAAGECSKDAAKDRDNERTCIETGGHLIGRNCFRCPAVK